jgi:hypothetical protein
MLNPNGASAIQPMLDMSQTAHPMRPVGSAVREMSEGWAGLFQQTAHPVGKGRGDSREDEGSCI